MPTYTPVRLPPRRSGAWPARSSASNLTSRRRRCCGGTADAPPGPAPAEAVGRLARALERLQRDLEQETMLRVHRDRLARGDPEECGVEAVHVLDERPPACGDAPRGGHVGIVVGVDVPPIARHLGHRVDPVVP